MKSLKEKVVELVTQKCMYSCMNNTKWKELQNAIEDLPFPPPYVLKSVCEDETEYHKFGEDVWYLGDWSSEALLQGDFFAIEWMKIRPRYKQHQGHLIADKIIDETVEFLTILEKYNIPFEEQDGVYIIYGYQSK